MSTRSKPISTKPNEGTRRLYGRRQAFKLRSHQAQLIDDLLPQLSITVPEHGMLDPTRLFSAAREVWLEIGFGGGEHLAWQAGQNPDVGFIGVEPFINGMAKVLVQIEALGLKNIRLLQGDARHLIEHLPDASLDRAFLLFPDPWPKTRHHKRRYVQQETLDELARVLKDGAEFRVASDIPGYVAWTLERVMPHQEFDWTAEQASDWQVRPKNWPPTRYEQKALKAGRVSAYLKFLRRPRA